MAQVTFRGIVNPKYGRINIESESLKKEYTNGLKQVQVAVEYDSETLVEYTSSLKQYDGELISYIPKGKLPEIPERDVYTITVET